MKVEVHLLTHDEEPLIGWALRHYRTFATKIVIHDGGPKGRTNYGYEDLVEVRFWDTAGQLNDELACHLKNTCWRGTDADWVICADADELIYFPLGAETTLGMYEKGGAAVPKPKGFEMFSETWRETWDSYYADQIYDWVKEGAPDEEWYAKPILFSPKRVAESGFGIGAHESEPLLKNGVRLRVDRKWPSANPPVWLLHFHQLGGIERIAARYDATRKRLASVNERNRWGNFSPGAVHAQEKRDKILPKLQRVIA